MKKKIKKQKKYAEVVTALRKEWKEEDSTIEKDGKDFILSHSIGDISELLELLANYVKFLKYSLQRKDFRASYFSCLNNYNKFVNKQSLTALSLEAKTQKFKWGNSGENLTPKLATICAQKDH